MRAFVLAAGLWMLALPLWADARSTVLVDVLRLGELAEILQREGLENAETLDRDMLGGQGGAGWRQKRRKGPHARASCSSVRVLCCAPGCLGVRAPRARLRPTQSYFSVS